VILRTTEERVVVVSDLHLGSPASSAAKHFGAFLDDVAQSGRALCVNGDGFDLLQSSTVGLATFGFPVLRRLQELAMSGVPVYYVLGNHDLALERVLFDLPFSVVPFLNLRSGDQLIRVEHGHLHEPVYARFPRAYQLAGRLGRLPLLVHADSYELWSRAQKRVDDRRRQSGRPQPYAHYEAARDLFRRGFDAVVFGHTHRPERIDLDGGTFVNGGDWLRRRTCVTIDSGALAVKEWSPGALVG
jgi:UDP-2,3-diacylglucosamine pyrophosphatase LpxH